jgi:hypothetical protein
MKIIATGFIRKKIMGVIYEWEKGDIIELPDKKEPGEDWYENGEYHLLIGHGCGIPIEGFEKVE